MTLHDLYMNFSVELKGALAGGIVSAILDRGTIFHRFVNGCGSVIFSITMTPAVIELFGWYVFRPTDAIRTSIAAILALVGLIVAEALQRTARRIASRSGDIGDSILDKIPGMKSNSSDKDKKDD